VNAIHQHLLVNHLPIFGAYFAIPILLLSLALRRERGLLLAAVFLLVVTAIGGWVSLSTGESAMDAIEGQEGKPWYKAYDEASETVLAHEERAETATWIATGAAVLGVAVLVLAHFRPVEEPLGRAWIAAALAGAVVTAAAMSYTGNAGGVIMHREIRGDELDTTSPK
jgi:peptidoglycan/LPS O-acetylase OafA/YrhL